MTDISRFDNLVRTERYFTATLLPAILLHNDFQGLNAFLDLIDQTVGNETLYESSRSGKRLDRQVIDSPFTSDQVEIVTEFHIRRDLDFFRDWHASQAPATDLEAEKQRRDAPDLVIIVGDEDVGYEMVVCEAKFFWGLRPEDLRNLNLQLASQRTQIRHLLKARPSLPAYRHLALLPRKPDSSQVRLQCSGVLTWGDIADLAGNVLGEAHYVTKRLRKSVAYCEELHGDPSRPWFSGALSLDALLEKCRAEEGESIIVGHRDGERGLRRYGLNNAKSKRWHWRDTRDQSLGGHVPKNWIGGKRFVGLIEEMETEVGAGQ